MKVRGTGTAEYKSVHVAWLRDIHKKIFGPENMVMRKGKTRIGKTL